MIHEIISGISVEQEAEENELREMLNKFLKHLPKQKWVTFLRRYWYLLSIKEIAEKSKTSESQIKSTLFRLRNELKTFLESEGIGI
jgi:RNA polymerase sigma-70 factor (ECF subfamily)